MNRRNWIVAPGALIMLLCLAGCNSGEKSVSVADHPPAVPADKITGAPIADASKYATKIQLEERERLRAKGIVPPPTVPH